MQIFDDFNELYKKFTFVTYDPLNPEDAVSICFDFQRGSLNRSIANDGSVCLSVCHTSDPRLNG